MGKERGPAMRFCLVAAFGILAGTLPAEAQPPRPKDKAVVGKVSSQPSQPKADDPRVGGKTLSQWRSELSSEDASKRALAVVAIMGFGEEGKEAVPDIVKRLRDDDLSPRAK